MRTNSFYPLCFFSFNTSVTHISRSQCNSLCHVTLSHTYTVGAKAAPPHRAPHTHSSKTSQKPELRPHTTHQSRERTIPNNIQTCNIQLCDKPKISEHIGEENHAGREKQRRSSSGHLHTPPSGDSAGDSGRVHLGRARVGPKRLDFLGICA